MRLRFKRVIWGSCITVAAAIVLIVAFKIQTRGVYEALERGQVVRATSDLRLISTALMLHYAEHFAYPTSAEGIEDLPFVSNLLDPWGNPYIYRGPGGSGAFEVYTLGADGREGGSGIDADIVMSVPRGSLQ